MVSSTSSAELRMYSEKSACCIAHPQHAVNLIAQCFRQERLSHVTFRSASEHLLPAMVGTVSGDHYYRNAAQRFILFQAAEEFIPIHFGHIDIGQNQVNPVLGQTT